MTAPTRAQILRRLNDGWPADRAANTPMRPWRRGGADLAGRRFGRLLVLERAAPPEHAPPNRYRHWWLCRCDCGTTKVICMQNLTAGLTVSCGCRQREAAVENAAALNARRRKVRGR
jgi:hypothetical protein